MKFKRIENADGYDTLLMYDLDIEPENGVPIEFGVLNVLDFNEIKRVVNNKIALYLERNPTQVNNINKILPEMLRLVINQQIKAKEIEHS